MSSSKLVSVIIPFYDSEVFLKDAVESVIAQSYKSWELLLIDDGSTDSSTAIALDYANKYPDKIHYLQHEEHKNMGACASRNLGIQQSKGKYIALLDSDDVWLPEKLEQQIDIIQKNKDVDAVIGLSEYWHSWSGNSKELTKDHIPELGLTSDIVYKPPSLLKLIFPLGKANAPCPSVLLLTKNILKKIGGFEQAFTGLYQYYEDQAFLSKLYLNALIYPAENCWIKYRIHPDSCSSRVKKLGEHNRVKLHYFYWLKRYFYDNGFNEKHTLDILNENILELESNIEKDVRKWEKIAKNRKNEINELKKQIAVLKKELVKESNKKQHNTDKKLNNLTIKTISAEGARLLTKYISSPGHYLTKTVRNIENIIYDTEDKPFGKKRLKIPVSKKWGWERGTPIDRYYIDKFLKQNSEHIKGNVLEINDDIYTKKFGGQDVIRSDVLDINEKNENATIIADLQKADNIQSNSFDCIILTQTLQLTYDYESVIKNCERILKKDGVLLATFPGITKILVNKPFKWYWNFTSFSAEVIFNKYFDKEKVEISKHGNVLSASAFLFGLARQELTNEELDYNDPEFEVIITIKAVK
jgi:glycosyltransferase involved in cell wall biosynthesis